MKKNFLVILLSAAISFLSWSQPQKLKLAAKQYSSYDYSEAARNLEKMQKNDVALRSLADSYYKIQQYIQSEQAYSQLVALPSAGPADMVNYISVLLVNEKYPEAISWMEKFSSAYPSDDRYSSYLSANNIFEKLKTDAGQFSVRNLDINSEQEDFGTVFYKDSIVFTSSREKVKPVKRTWNGNKLPYLDLYHASIDSRGELKNIKLFNGQVNQKYHEASASFTKDGSVIAFTRNNYEAKSSDGVRKLQLFISKVKNDTWTKPEGMPFNSNEYSVGHPAFNDDGTLIYFASDMPGGKGGTDIYKAKRNPDGTWGQPQNLGDKINTPGNEMFPFLHSSGLLFFSSTGHEGLGGLDVFAARTDREEAVKIKNVGAPVNSSKDDFSFILNQGMSFGYFASNREGGKGNDDIYYYQLLKPIRFGKTISGTVKSDGGEILANVNVMLKEESGKEIKSVISDANGKFSFETEDDKLYVLTGSLKNYVEVKKNADARESDEVHVDLILEPLPVMSVSFSVRDKKSGLPLSGVAIAVIDNTTGKEVASFVTDAAGFKRMPVSDKAEGIPYAYVITMRKEGYLSRSVVLDDIAKRGELKMTETLDKIEIGTDLGKILDIKPIYFNLGKWDIRKDATVELDKIIKAMNENPGMEIELGSHTDCRGTATANFLLSDKRAKSSAAYVKKKIAQPGRIYGKGYGESNPMNDCKCEGTVKSSCPEGDHQKNRRTEFKVVKM